MSEKKCFIITPIGDEGTSVRRHIDGIIDAVLKPVVEDEFKYELEVSHRIDEPGNISNQVILSIYKSELVIANLTSNNPNVMYEVALRHCFGTPAIMIAENGTKIPADIVGERTIFYTNDAAGVLELKDKLRGMIRKIQLDNSGTANMQGPVYDALRGELETKQIIQELPSKEKAEEFSLIIDMLDQLKKEIRSNKVLENNIDIYGEQVIKIHINLPTKDLSSIKMELEQGIQEYLKMKIRGCDVHVSEHLIRIRLPYMSPKQTHQIVLDLKKYLNEKNIEVTNVNFDLSNKMYY